MFDFFRNLFIKKYPRGAFKNPEDSRNIHLSSFQSPVSLPEQYQTKMPVVDHQGGSECVGYAITKVAELYFIRKGAEVDLSPLDLYFQAKREDGIPDMPGTYPIVAGKIAVNKGIASELCYNLYQDKQGDLIVKNRVKAKLGGYAFVSANFEAICQAIYQNGAVTASFNVDIGWYLGKIGKVKKSLGRHYVVLHGFNIRTKTFVGQNSWGTNWVGNLENEMTPNIIAPGHFEMKWDDVALDIVDIMVFADVPKELIDAAKGLPYQFTTTMRFGSMGYEVKKLQEYFKIKADGNFGGQTQAAVRSFQQVNRLTADGIVGQNTRALLNKKL